MRGDLDTFEAFQNRIERRLNEFRGEAGEEFERIIAEMAQRGLATSGPRMRAQLDAIENRAFRAIDFVLREAEQLPGAPGIRRAETAPGLRAALERHVDSLYDRNWRMPGARDSDGGVGREIDHHRQRMRIAVNGEVDDYEHGVWRPRGDGLEFRPQTGPGLAAPVAAGDEPSGASLSAQGAVTTSGQAELTLSGGTAIDPVRWADWVQTYHQRADDVGSPSAPPEGLQRRLKRWFDHVDGLPEARAYVVELEGRVDWQDWISSAGPGALNWATEDLDLSLARLLVVCRRLANGDLAAQQFAGTYWNVGGRLSAVDAARILVLNVFEPMQRELLTRLITRQRVQAAQAVQTEPEVGARTAPASDRIVRIDHNSAAYNDAVAKLDEVAEALRGLNDFPDPEVKEQLTTELAVGRRLFEAPRVREIAVRVVLIAALAALTALVPGFGVNVLAAAAIKAVEVALRSGREL